MRSLSTIVRRRSLALGLILIVGACGAPPSAPSPVTVSCSATNVGDVEAALEGVSGYTFTASGTSLRSRPVADPSNPWSYDSPRIELRGAYQAPDRSRLEVVARDDGPPLSAPHIFFLGVDAIVVIGDQLWLVSEDHIQGPEPTDDGSSNLLLNVLRPLPELGVTWVSAGDCTFDGRASQGALSVSIQVEVRADGLPIRIVEGFRYEPPNEERRAYDLTYLPDYAQVPEIEAPRP